MADLTPLDEKLGEVLGLAQAAQDTAQKVAKMEGADPFAADLERMRSEGEDVERRTMGLVETLEGKKTAIVEKGRETKKEASEMRDAYLEGEEEALDGFEFMTMAEAGEVGHWQVLEQMNKKAKHPGIRQLTKEQLAIQKRHLREVMLAATTVAAQEDPDEEG